MSDSPSAVRFYAAEHPVLPRTLRQKLSQRVDQLAGQVAGGYASEWSDYKERIGVIKGLSEAIDICRQVEKDLEH